MFATTDFASRIAGFGLGLRPNHYADFASRHLKVDWLEVISENYMVAGGQPLHYLDKIRRDYPMVMHGVSMSIGSADPLDFDYLRTLRELAARIEPAWISDHLCWTGVAGRRLHDLLPLPYTTEALDHVAGRVEHVQDFLKRPLILENVSTYVAFRSDEMTEWEFLAELTRRTGCYLLLDVNNVYVSSVNHGFDPRAFIDGVPPQRVVQIHLAGHEDHGDYIIDTHDQDICNAVWKLYAYTLRRIGTAPTMIEWDANIPPLDSLIEELEHARRIAAMIAEEAVHTS